MRAVAAISPQGVPAVLAIQATMAAIFMHYTSCLALDRAGEQLVDERLLQTKEHEGDRKNHDGGAAITTTPPSSPTTRLPGKMTTRPQPTNSCA